MSQLKKRHEFVLAVALLVAAFSTSCTAWHTIPLEPQRFSAETSPELTRLTFNDGTEMRAGHPVLVGDSLVWKNGSGESPRDSTRSAVPASSIQQVEVNRIAAGRTVVLLGVLGGLTYAVLHGLHNFTTAGN